MQQKLCGRNVEFLNYSSILTYEGSARDTYLAALLRFLFFSISLKCNFFVFVFVDVLLCFY